MNKKEMTRLIKSQAKQDKIVADLQKNAFHQKGQIDALILAVRDLRNPHLAGEPEPKAAIEMRELAEAVTRDKPVLSGNERIKKLLEKQLLVFIKTSDVSYEDAKHSDFFRVCDRINNSYNYPISTTSETSEEFMFGIPFDEHGNEITEV